ncbi:MAG: AarF/ABC1/UbiB kinase family protein [Verrucomicrobia bacterium]|nr:AarF/ABC1/UbiB kinase family protein [Verrucomicrobiota bacterium]
MLINKLENLGRAFQHLQRYRDVVKVFLKYGYDDLAHHLHLPKSLGLHWKRESAEHAAILQMSQPERLRRACEELGPTFVKLGQILSTRPNLLPPAFTEELAKLQDQVAPIPFSEVRKVLEAELQCPLEEVFASVDEQPLAAASIAQVHRARLRNGADAVVKVQRPGIRHIVEVDLEIMRHLAELMEKHLEGWRVHRPAEVVAEISRVLEKELDFTVEAAHMERFARQFAGEPMVCVPKVFHDFTTRQVLTMEYVDGIKASCVEELDAAQLDRREVARRIADLVIRQVFVHGFFHADPHPGNIHILPGQVICFLDFGMMGYLNQRGREDFADLVWGITRRNEIVVAAALLKLSAAPPESNPQGLEADVAEFMHQHFYRPLKELEFGKLVTQLVQLAAKYHLRTPPDFFIMLKAVSAMEGLVRRLHPDYDVVGHAAPFLKQVRLGRFSPKRLMESFFEFGMDFTGLARELPSELRRILAQFKSGETKVIFKHDGLEPLTSSLDQISNRIAFSVVLAALIIGSSVIVHAGIPPKWHDVPIIGILGFVIAALMGFRLLIAIIKHGKM